MTQLSTHSFETHYDAPADRHSIPLTVTTDEEAGESSPRKAIGRLRAGVHDAINRWLQRLRRRRLNSQNGRGQFPDFLLDTNPSIDLEETDDDIVVLAELPGLDARDFAIETDGRRLILRGQKKEESEERGRRYYYAERRFGAFSRAILLPCEVDANRASATYRNGLLRIVLPKAPEAKGRRRRIQIA
jgi:HSP20 family protein